MRPDFGPEIYGTAIILYNGSNHDSEIGDIDRTLHCHPSPGSITKSRIVTMIKCPYCQATYVENTLFCSECGSYLPQGENHKTDPLNTSELNWLRDLHGKSRPDSPAQPEPEPLKKLHLKIGEEKRVIELTLDKTITMGRVDPTSNVFPEVEVSEEGDAAKSVSRRHARILRQEDSVVIEDLASINGTFLNGKRLSPYIPEKLQNGDVIHLGKVTIEISINPA